MIDRDQYTPGPASGAQVRTNGQKWTLVLVRELRHSPEKVWQAAMKFGVWQRLNAEYAEQFGVEPPGRPSRSLS